MSPRGDGMWGRALEEVERRTGLTVERTDRIERLEEAQQELGAVTRELDLIGWNVLDYLSGTGHEVNAQTRVQWARKARNIWLQDPQAGASVDLMNDFVFGRGVPKPRAKDDEVQQVLDDVWDDPDNQLVLTSYAAQVALGTDLSLQSNVFMLMFEGDDGKVKLGLLPHDEVKNAVRDPNNRLRVLYYLAAHRPQDWDFQTDAPKVDVANQAQPKMFYYEHWRNVELAGEEGEKPPVPPKDKRGDGKVYHVAINRTTEQVFGNPQMRRLVRWFSAYNDFMASRVDMAQAAAAFIMRRKIKGTPHQVAKMAAKAISRQSELAGLTGTDDMGPQIPPRGGSILTENENVQHDALNLNSNSAGAMQDAQMIRANISAGTRFPQSYYGDASNSNLATATSLELPVLKAVEARQEVFEGVFRWFLDRAIEVAVDTGRLDLNATVPPDDGEQEFFNFGTPDLGQPDTTGAMPTQQSYENQDVDEADTERDLSYEFSMPSPLRRMMVDLVTAVTEIAKTFDPNGTNMELARVLMTIVLGEALEVQDPADAVQKIFPPGYVDPAILAQEQGGGPGGPPMGPPGPPGAAGDEYNATGQGGQPTDPSGNPYSAPGMSPQYQGSQGQSAYGGIGTPTSQAELMNWFSPSRLEERYGDRPEDARAAAVEPVRESVRRMFEEDVVSVVGDELTRAIVNGENHNGNGASH